jgi:signal transduction histidine kinase
MAGLDHPAEASLPGLSVPDGPALPHYLATALQQVTGASCAYLAHRRPDGKFEVLGSAGMDGPAPGSRLPPPVAVAPTRMVLPLTVGASVLGALVADGIAAPMPGQAQRELSLLVAAGALSLQNHSLLGAAARQAAEASHRQYQLLSGTIYHLKNTLANSSEYLELLQLAEALSERQQEYAARSRRSVDVALRLLTELHDLGMADSGQLVPQREPLNVMPLLRDLVQDYRLSAGTTTVSFALELPDLAPLHTDGDCIRQILDTLVSNAIRYSPPGGIVTVRALVIHGRRANDPDRWLRIDIADMGPGVGEEDDVFEEVQRVSRKGPPGFRLAIARRLARLLGGDLVLQTARGEGSTFSLWLPLSE